MAAAAKVVPGGNNLVPTAAASIASAGMLPPRCGIPAARPCNRRSALQDTRYVSPAAPHKLRCAASSQSDVNPSAAKSNPKAAGRMVYAPESFSELLK